MTKTLLDSEVMAETIKAVREHGNPYAQEGEYGCHCGDFGHVEAIAAYNVVKMEVKEDALITPYEQYAITVWNSTKPTHQRIVRAALWRVHWCLMEALDLRMRDLSPDIFRRGAKELDALLHPTPPGVDLS